MAKHPGHENEPSELLQAVMDSIFGNSETVGANGAELFTANQPGTIIPNAEQEGTGPADTPGTPEAVNVTSTSGLNTATAAEVALNIFGGPLQASLLSAVTSGMFGQFGVVGDFTKPIPGTLHFAKTIEAMREEENLTEKAAGIAGHSAISAALNDDFEDDFGNFGDFGETGSAANPGGGGRDSGGGGNDDDGPNSSGGFGGDDGFGGPSFKHGGRPPVGVPVLVGEGGPEQFIPDSPSLFADPTGVGEQIIRQMGVAKITEMLSGGGNEKENKEKKASPKKKKTESNPTQKTDKPVQKAAAERKARRFDIEQLLRDLLAGKLNVQS